MNLGYANWGECDDKVTTAAVQGVNVIVWFALSLTVTQTGKPNLNGGPNLTCVGELARDLESRGLPTHHLISIGGWNAPHPSPTVSADAWWAVLKAYNADAHAAGLDGGFDGIDWDLEGHNDRNSSTNRFPADELRLVARISELAKEDGRLVFMVPAQSYLDANTSEFALDVLHPALCWHSDFEYAGRNVYAALLALAQPGTFDLVSLQLYESWSEANCALAPPSAGGRGLPLAAYLGQLVERMHTGWLVDFAAEPSLALPAAKVQVPAHQLALGLANGWTGQGGCRTAPCKALYVDPDELKAAWAKLDRKPRGLFFWDIANEGDTTGSPPAPLHLAQVFNDILRTRGG